MSSAPVCRVCGRPVRARNGGRGRRKEAHHRCIIFASRMVEIERLLREMKFQSRADVKKTRGEVMALLNGPLHPYSVQIAPDEDEDI